MRTLEEFQGEAQRLTDKRVLLEFNELDGKVQLVDSVAAGGAWHCFQFVDGPFAGRKIYCAENARMADPPEFQYVAHASEDGFVFNADPARPLKESEESWGGEFYPEWDKITLTLKDPGESGGTVAVPVNAVLGAIFNNTPDNPHRDRLVQIIADDLAGNGYTEAAAAIPELWARYKKVAAGEP